MAPCRTDHAPRDEIHHAERDEYGDIAANVAPGNPYLGVMLPYTPLHHLLMEAVARPLVCTSGNLSEEPMAIEIDDALHRLGGLGQSNSTGKSLPRPSPICSWSTIVPSCGRWTIPSPASAPTVSRSCGVPAASPRCRSS